MTDEKFEYVEPAQAMVDIVMDRRTIEIPALFAAVKKHFPRATEEYLESVLLSECQHGGLIATNNVSVYALR